MLECHLCPARFNDDNAFAEHIGRHRRGGDGDRRTNQRQAQRAMVDDLKEILDGTS